jgi:hypothetical protein
MVSGSVNLKVMEDSAGNSTFFPPVAPEAASPPPAPTPAPIAAPLPPPARAPMSAPTAAPPPVTTAVRLPLPFWVPPYGLVEIV